MAARLSDHLTFHGLREPTQSAYCTRRSTETALLYMSATTYILKAVDRGEAVILALLDLGPLLIPLTMMCCLNVCNTGLGHI